MRQNASAFPQPMARSFGGPLTLDATPIQQGVDVQALHEGAQGQAGTLASLHPLRHANEFEHLPSTADLREFHARFKKLENEVQSPQFSATRLPYKIRALRNSSRNHSFLINASSASTRNSFMRRHSWRMRRLARRSCASYMTA